MQKSASLDSVHQQQQEELAHVQNECKQQISTLEGELATAQQRLAEVEGKISGVELEKNTLQESHDNTQRELMGAKETIQALQQQLADTTSKTETSIASNQAELDTLEKAKQTLQESYDKQNTALQEAKSVLQSVEEERAEAKAKYEKELASLQVEIESLTQQKIEAEKRLVELEQSNEALGKELVAEKEKSVQVNNQTVCHIAISCFNLFFVFRMLAITNCHLIL